MKLIFLFIILIESIKCFNLTVPSGRFTLKFSFTSNHTSFYFKFSQLLFQVNQTDLVLTSSNFNKIKYPQAIDFYNLNTLWISVNFIDRKNLTNNFIKIGHDLCLLNNTLYHFTPFDYDTLRSVRYVTSFEIDPTLHVYSHKLEPISLIKDLTFKIYGHNRQVLDDYETPMTKQSLPDELKTIYEVIKNRGPILDSDEIDAIKFSFENPGCLLNPVKTVNVKFNFESFSFDGQPFMLEIQAPSTQTQLRDNSNYHGIIKVIDGDLQINFYNSVNDSRVIKSCGLGQDDLGWFSPDMFQIFKIINPNSHKSLIFAKSYVSNGKIVTNDSGQTYLYDEFKNIVLYEYYTRSCKRKLTDCCEYTGLVCGWKLKENSNCSILLDGSSLYLCDRKENTVKLIEKCDELCYQDKLATRCKQRLYARAEFDNGFLNFNQTEKFVRLTGRVENVEEDRQFWIKFYSGYSCDYRDQVFSPTLTANLEELKVESDERGVIVVDLKVDNFNLIETSSYNLFDRVVILETVNGSMVQCGVVKKTVSILQTTKTATTTRILYAKWVDSKSNRSYVSYGDGQHWIEYNNDIEIAMFKFVKYEGNDVIIYDENRKFYAKLTDAFVMWGNDDSYKNWEFGIGRWELKPKMN